jgi:hypothetical protein
MRCKTCDYSLWALKTRQCPECGRPFVLSEFDFIPGSVRFGCPFCDQSYYGTASNGHLVPAEFNCVKCGQPVRMDDMVLFPAEGVQERQTQPEGQPWLERAERGRAGAWFRTIGLALVAPQRLIRLTPVESPVGTAWWFALVSQLLFSSVGVLPLVLFPIILISSMRGGGGGPGAAGVGYVFGGFFLAAWLGVMALIAIWGLVTHGILRMTGGTEYTIGRTYQALCYSSGANVLMAVPCFGFHLTFSGLSSIWWMVSAVLMVKEGQRVHGGRATLAVLTLPVLIALSVAGLMTLAIVSAVSKSGMPVKNLTSMSTFSQSAAAVQIQSALTAYMSQHQGLPPGHAIDLLNGNYLADADVLLISDAENRKARVPVADKTLADFPDLSVEERRRVAKAAGDLARNAPAPRLGDIVFTCQGIGPAITDGNLWLFIIWPDAGSGGDMSEQTVTVGRRNGTWQFTVASMPGHLAEQNRLRAQYGLPPLPHPKDVAHPRVVPAPPEMPTPEAESEPQ